MASSNISKISGGKKKTTQSVEKAGRISTPATVPQPSLREIPRVNEKKPAADIDTGNPASAATSSAAGRAVSSVASAASSGGAASSAARDAAPQRASVAFTAPDEDEQARLDYESALERLNALQAQAPVYTSRYDAQIRDLYEQITGRGAFRYDSATDPLYQQYRQDYTAQGRMAMRDTMGQAAALTGGYGSSYAQSVGQQQYDAYLQCLADVLPETYGMALDAWTSEGRDLQRRYQAAAALEQSDYERYLDELGQYNRTLERARSDADAAYERKLASEERAYRRASDDYKRRIDSDERAYRRRKAKA